jgi:hypothetical protein
MRRMKNLACVLLVAGLAASPAFAGSKQKPLDIKASNWALGIFLGEPTGITAQLDLADTQALEFKAAWNFVSTKSTSDSGTVTLQGNYVLWFPGLLVFDGVDVPPFVGVGAEIRVGSDLPVIGIRIPFGVRYRFREAPIELALELGAGMSLFPSTSFMGSGGIAIRWMF